MLKLILGLHIAAGTTALVSMWIPMAARKGAALHRKAGQVFVAAMATVSVTALLLAAARFLTDPTEHGRQAGLFLLLVTIVTGAAVSAGVRVLKTKRRTAPHLHWWDIGLAGLLVVAGIGGFAYGVATGAALFIAFSALALANGAGQLRYWLRAPQAPLHWWFEHMSAMLGACIAATTAFLVVNASRWGLETFSLVVWVAPSIVGGIGIAVWTRYYRRRFAAAPLSSRLKAQGTRDKAQVEAHA
jgi:uncharacterized membrane protein